MDREHDGNCRGRLPGSLDERRRWGEDHVDIHADKLGHQRGQLIDILRPLPFDDDVGALDVAEVRPAPSHSTTPSHSRALPAVKIAGGKLALELRMVPARGLEDFDSAFATMAQERVGGFLAVGSPLVVGQRVPLAALALKHPLPGMFPFKENVVAGGLMSYGADPNYLYRRAAAYIDKILKGAKPADLPVEQASKYELVINLKTAKALGLHLPASVLARADEVIE